MGVNGTVPDGDEVGLHCDCGAPLSGKFEDRVTCECGAIYVVTVTKLTSEGGGIY